MKYRKNEDVETLAYKFRIYPNEEQRTMLAKTFGCTRYLWNTIMNFTVSSDRFLTILLLIIKT